MATSHFEFLVEDSSMEAFLSPWLPGALPEGCTFGIYPHSGKGALLRKLGARLKGYSAYMPPEYRIVVIVDRDRDECRDLKSRLEAACESAGLRSRRNSDGPDWQVVTRIAIEELEAWYFGDWQAVRAAYPKVSPHILRRAKYRDPDSIAGGTWEAFERVLREYGYFKQGLDKVRAATAIGQHIDPARNRSRSFGALHEAITEVAA